MMEDMETPLQGSAGNSVSFDNEDFFSEKTTAWEDAPSVTASPQKSTAFLRKTWIDFEKSYSGFPYKIPCIHAHGAEAGPNLLVTSTIHGDELNGIPIIHALADKLDPSRLRGEIVLLPVVNILAFHIHSRYLPDRRDLNRLFPGSERGSEGGRLASLIWSLVGQKANAIIDLHSASYDRWNYPHIRGNMEDVRVRKMAEAFGADISIHSAGISGSLRRAAAKEKGIPAILFEAGQINRFEKEFRDTGVKGIFNVMRHLGMMDELPQDITPPQNAAFYLKNSSWVRSPSAGLFDPFFKPGDRVKRGEKIGRIISLLGEETDVIYARHSGIILGCNLHPQVAAGRALYHVGYTEKEL